MSQRLNAVRKESFRRRAGVLPVMLMVAGVLGACDHKQLDNEPAHGKTLPADFPRVEAGPSKGAEGPMAGGPMGGSQMGGGQMGGSGGSGASATGGGVLTGSVTLGDAVKDKVPQGAVLFLYARRPGMDKGPPLATIRLDAQSFPVAFQLSQANVMLEGLVFDGEVNLSARLDNDGNAMTRNPGDLTGSVPGLKVGTEGVTLELNQVLP